MQYSKEKSDYRIESKVICLVGEERVKKYYNIFPLLRLIYYRLDANPHGLFAYDGISLNFKSYKTQHFKYTLKDYFFAFVHHLISLPCYFNRKQMSNKLEVCETFFSDTFLMLSRYEYIINMILDNYKVASVMTLNTYDARGRICNKLDIKRYNSRCVFLGNTVCGWKIKYYVFKISNLMYDAIENNRCFDDYIKKTDVLLYKLDKNVTKRINKIEKVLKQSNIKSFITANQYSVNDWLCIKACENIGIKTKQLSHYAYNMAPINFTDENENFDFVSEECAWNEPSISWLNKYMNTKHYGKGFMITSVGNPEIIQDLIKPGSLFQRDVILFFFPDLEYFRIYDESEMTDDIRNTLRCFFEQINMLKLRYNYEVLIRIRPDQVLQIHGFVQNYSDKYGFRIMENDVREFQKCLIRTGIAIGSGTSALELASEFGCNTYNVIIQEHEYDFCGQNIKNIQINEIHNCENVLNNTTEINVFNSEKLLFG